MSAPWIDEIEDLLRKRWPNGLTGGPALRELMFEFVQDDAESYTDFALNVMNGIEKGYFLLSATPPPRKEI